MPKVKLRLKKNTNKSEMYRIIIFMIAIIFIVSIAYLSYLKSNNSSSEDMSVADLFGKLFSFSKEKDVEIKTVSFKSNDYEDFGVSTNYIYVVSLNSIKIYDKSGGLIDTLDIKMSNPIVKNSGEYALVGDLDSKNFVFLNKGKIVKKIKTDNNIINFSLNSDGYILYIDEANEYKTSATLLNNEGEKIFNTAKGEQFIVEAKISDNEKYAVLSIIDTSGAYSNTNIEFLDTSKNFGDIISSSSKKDVIYSTILTFGNDIVAVGSSEIASFDMYSTKKWEKEFNGRIQSICKMNSKRFAISANNSNNNIMDINESEVKIFDLDGEEKEKFNIEGRVKNIKAYDNIIMSYTSRAIYINDDDGDLLWEKTWNKDIIDVHFLYKDRIVVVDREKFEILKIDI
jgi:hypothetical protein